MINRSFETKYEEYASLEELSVEDRELAKAAIDAMRGSYAPYSGFNVGAAVRLESGHIVKGANQENAAYPSGLCAERSACYYAGATWPDAKMLAIAIAAKQDGKLTATPTYPCGACRQALVQYESKGGVPMTVIVGSAGRVEVFASVRDLLPFVFDNLDDKPGE